jgi:hypothetical protein
MTSQTDTDMVLLARLFMLIRQWKFLDLISAVQDGLDEFNITQAKKVMPVDDLINVRTSPT